MIALSSRGVISNPKIQNVMPPALFWAPNSGTTIAQVEWCFSDELFFILHWHATTPPPEPMSSFSKVESSLLSAPAVEQMPWEQQGAIVSILSHLHCSPCTFPFW